MMYRYKIIISKKSFYKEIELAADVEKIKIGTTSACEVRLNSEIFFYNIVFEVEKSNNQWQLLCSDAVYISRGDMRKLLSCELKHGDVLELHYAQSGDLAVELRFMIDFEAKTPFYNWKIDISNKDSIVIGDTSNCDIVISSQFSGNNKLRLIRNTDGFELEEVQSEFGVYLNGKKIESSTKLKNYDFFSVANFFFYYKEKQLYFDMEGITAPEERVVEIEPEGSFQYPLFVRNTRIRGKIDEESIKILEPASKPTKPELNIVTSLMPTLVMFALVVVLRGIMSTSSGTYVLFTICSMGMGVVTSVLSVIETQKKYKKECTEREKQYIGYIEKKKAEISNARQYELDCLNETYISTEQDIDNIMNFDAKLFERLPEDEDFLDIYLGEGRIAAKKLIDYKEQEKLEVGDELSRIPLNIYADFKYIDNAPVTMKLRDANAVGIVGNQEQQYQLFKKIVVDIISRQYHSDVKLYVLLGNDDVARYDWIRKLPHIQNGDNVRNIVCDNESKNSIFEYLYKELTYRSEENGEYAYNVILVMNEQGIKSHPISKFIENASALKTVFVFFENKEEHLPLYCSNIVRVNGENSGVLFNSQDRGQYQSFCYRDIADEDMYRVVQKLAPVYCEEISLAGTLRKNISLFELLGIYSVEDLDLEARWNSAEIYNTMAVPLGVNVKDDIVYLNLHEKAHGPHGLVAGTTGSGKSEILQTYILSAATLFHPYEIGFMIIDFKGGGMVNQFKDLPHLIGAITNIDGKEIARSLKSIKAELLKRQTFFAEVGVNHIDKYIKLFKEGKAKKAIPHLVIIVDEFAELKAEQPEFMKELMSAARIGRSLGVHLILATQKPAGQVNEQIWSNSKFKLCLKVQTQEDSNEVLKSPLASEIREPGRAYLQVGNNEIFELFQSGYSGSPEKSVDGKSKNIALYSLDFTGKRKEIYKQTPERETSARTQLEAIVDCVNQYCKEMNIKQLQQICLPPLERKIIFDVEKYASKKSMEMRCSIGIYDDPDRQYQGVAGIDLASQNTLIIGSAQYGKTNLLELIIRNLAEIYTPDEVNMYIIDFGSMVLKNFEKLSHVGGVVCPADDEKLKNLFKYLNDQIQYRREKLLTVGVSSFSSYMEAGYKEIPQIMVFIDNLTMLRELYLSDNDVLLNLTREGNSVGINFVIANAQTNGIGYKYLANFASRIALFCNESSEYNSLFGSCRLRPDEVPGRGMIEIDKTVYEYQTFLAFRGEKEIERVRDMQECIEKINQKNIGMHAALIPEIPERLTDRYVIEKFNYVTQTSDKVVLGLSYATISPVLLELLKNNMLAISGREASGKTNFIKYFVHAINSFDAQAEITIFDNYRKKLRELQNEKKVISYNITTEGIKETFVALEVCLKQRYEALVGEQPVENTWQVIIINNEDVIDIMSTDKEVLNIFKNLISKYKMLNVCILFGCLPNAPIPYGAPEIYKIIKEYKNILFFDDLENCKILDVPLSIVRTNKKKIEVGDCYQFIGNDCYKIKTPLAVIKNTL